MAQTDFLNTVINLLVLLVRKCDVLSNDGYDTISHIIHWKYNMVREWFTTKSKLSTTIVGAPYWDIKIKFIKSLELWATDLTLRGEYIDLPNLNAIMMADFIDEEKLDYEDGKKDP